MRRNRFRAACPGKEDRDSEPGPWHEEAGAARPCFLACQERKNPRGGTPGQRPPHGQTSRVEGASGQNSDNYEAPSGPRTEGRTKELPVAARAGRDEGRVCSATATPWTEDPACSLGPSQHLESPEPDWEGLSHRCLWLGEEGRKILWSRPARGP